MEPIVLLKIKSLHARSVQQDGLKIRYQGSDIRTGPIVAYLDDSAEMPANTGLIDLATGAIRLRWAVIATLPFLADAYAKGAIPQKDSAPVRAKLDECGQVSADGSGFNVKGTGEIDPGSVLSGGIIPDHQNPVLAVAAGGTAKIGAALKAGDAVRCTFVSESASLTIKLPKSLGGGTQHVNLAGGYLLVPVMTLERPTATKRSRR
jgi:hypothetical protein